MVRPAMRRLTFGENVQSRDPKKKSAIPLVNMSRDPSRSDSCPPSKVKAAVVIAYPESIQDKVARFDLKSNSISGKAMVVPVNAAGRRIIAKTEIARTYHAEREMR